MKSTFVRSVAGAGKTTSLVEQLLKVAQAFFVTNKRWPRVIATTFTNKATQELQERFLRQCLHEKENLLEFLDTSLHISTLHGVLSLFLKKYGASLNLNQLRDPLSSHSFPKSEKSLSFDFKVMNTSEVRLMGKSILKNILFSHQKKSQKLFENFGFERLLEVFLSWHRLYLESPLLTPHDQTSFTLTYQRQLKEWIQSLKTFLLEEIHDKKEGKSLKENLQKTLFHMKEFQKDLKIENEHILLESLTKTIDLITFQKRSSKGKKEKSYFLFLSRLHLFLKDVLSHLKKESFQIEKWSFFFDSFQLIDELARSFHSQLLAYKKNFFKWEINDLECLSLRLIEQQPKTAQSFSKDWDYWLIDEYQDTSPLQDKIFKSLIQNTPCFIVGDPQQSIYLFRGASAETFQRTEKKMKEQKAEIVFKNINYRASPELLSFLNDFFISLKHISSFEKMSPQKKTFNSDKIVAYFVASEENPPLTQKGEEEKDFYSLSSKPKTKFSSPSHEDLALIQHIQHLRKKETPYKDICILGRTHKILQNVSLVLKQHEIPFSFQSKAPLYEKREILDAKALLKFFLNPHDNLNLVQVFRSPCFYLSDEELLEHLSTHPESLWKELSNLEPLPSSVLRLKTYLELSRKEGVVQALKKSLIDSDFIDALYLYDSTGRAEANLWKWILQLERKEKQRGFHPLQFVYQGEKENREENSISSEEESPSLSWNESEKEVPSPFELESISLLTIHAAKGLTFKHVLLPHLHFKNPVTQLNTFQLTCDSSFRWSLPLPLGKEGKWVPSLGEEHFLKSYKKKEEAESDRLLYVALTRAQSSVFLSWTKKPSRSSSWASKIEEAWPLQEGQQKTDKYSYFVLPLLKG